VVFEREGVEGKRGGGSKNYPRKVLLYLSRRNRWKRKESAAEGGWCSTWPGKRGRREEGRSLRNGRTDEVRERQLLTSSTNNYASSPSTIAARRSLSAVGAAVASTDDDVHSFHRGIKKEEFPPQSRLPLPDSFSFSLALLMVKFEGEGRREEGKLNRNAQWAPEKIMISLVRRGGGKGGGGAVSEGRRALFFFFS
jgi:hypothetical protein